MKKIIDVQVGEVEVGQGPVILQSKAIGSCIAIVAYDAAKKIGALAHIMLPGRSPADKKRVEKTKYAANAIDTIVNKMSRRGSKKGDIEVALIGGGNILNRENDTICRRQNDARIQIEQKKVHSRSSSTAPA